MKATLILENWEHFSGESFWYEWQTNGEVVFNTWMVWYPEVLTDPSYTWQILVSTYPLVGNYGIPDFEETDLFWFKKSFESDKVHIQALIVSEYSENYNHFEANMSLWEFLKKHKIPAITWIDTRYLTQKIREKWAILGRIVMWNISKIPDTFDNPNERNLSAEVSCKEKIVYGNGKKTILLLDMGVKNNIIKNLLKYDTKVLRVSHDTKFMDEEIEFDGLFISNGPWDPTKNIIAIEQIKKAIKANKKIFWICLGNQLISLASGAKTYKLKYGHRGQNQPCKDTLTGKCIITSQNHGFAVDEKTLPKNIRTWFSNINDKTNEGIYFTDKNIRSVQFHPESTPGPNDANYLFKEFVDSL